MIRTVVCKICGNKFETENNRQIYCSCECKYEAKKRGSREKDIPTTKTYPSIYDMVEAMLKLSKKRGRIVQYGEVQKLILTGRLKVVRGRIIC